MTTGIAGLGSIALAFAAAFSYIAEHAGWIGDGDPEHVIALVVGAVAVGAYAAGGTPKRIVDETVALLQGIIGALGHD